MLGETSTDANREDDGDDENEDGTGEPDAKRRNQSQTSDTDDREEEEEEEELLSLNDRKGFIASNPSIGTQDDFEPNDLNDDDEFRLLDS